MWTIWLGNQTLLLLVAIWRQDPLSLRFKDSCDKTDLSFMSTWMTLMYTSFSDYEYVYEMQLNLDRLLSKMWDEMGLVRVYTKPQGQQPDFTDPVVLSTVGFYITFIYFYDFSRNDCYYPSLLLLSGSRWLHGWRFL